MKQLTPRIIFRQHMVLIGVLLLGHIIFIPLRAVGHKNVFGLSRMFHLAWEANLPATFSALALGLCALVAFAIARQPNATQQERRRWFILAWVFLFIALDEAIQIHELLNGRVSEALGANGAFRWLGPLPYVAVAGVLAILYWDWWLKQSPAVRWRIFFAGGLFVVAAAGMEMVEGILEDKGFGSDSWQRGISYVFEEGGEMFAVALFLNAYLIRLAELGGASITLMTIRGAEDKESAQSEIKEPRYA